VSQPARILLALILGLLLGIIGAAAVAGQVTSAAISIAEPVGGIWLDALRMTIIPLVVALLVTGIASTAEAARAGRLAVRSLILFLVILWSSSLIGAVLLPLFVSIWPLPAASGEALRLSLGGVETVGDVPGIAAFLRSVVPTNPFAAAANDAILPLIVFTTIFGFAITRLPPDPRERLTGFFSAIADAMLVVVGWVLWAAPIGVFALAFVVGARAGAGAVGALVHYVLAVSFVGVAIWLLAYPVARVVGGVRVGDFFRAMLPSQAVAVSTQSSLASLPPMLAASERLGVPVHAAGVVLPLAVALFRATGPAMNLAVALYIAHWFGIELSPLQIAAGVAAAAITTMGAVSLPGQVSFVTSIAPIALVMGVPIAPLGLLIAVEILPDIIRTLGNVSMDVAVTTAAARGEPELMGEERTTDGVAP
jgi:Na+/H+-dicarboxylate symporter